MSTSNLSRRLEQLESRLTPDIGEPRVLDICFVDADGRVVDHMLINLPGVPNKRGSKAASGRPPASRWY